MKRFGDGSSHDGFSFQGLVPRRRPAAVISSDDRLGSDDRDSIGAAGRESRIFIPRNTRQRCSSQHAVLNELSPWNTEVRVISSRTKINETGWVNIIFFSPYLKIKLGMIQFFLLPAAMETDREG